jgi:CBS domain-containing protein
MCDMHVGTVVVIDDHGGRDFPIGIITDRDMLRTQLNRSTDLFCLSVGEAYTPDPLCLTEDTGVAESLERMKARGVRRAPVVDAAGQLVGIVSTDDLLAYLAEQLSVMAKLLESQPKRESA